MKDQQLKVHFLMIFFLYTFNVFIGSDNKDESSNESHEHTSNGGLKEGGINDEDTLQYTIPTQGV